MDIREALKKQYRSALAMLKQEIELFPDDLWIAGEHPRQPWRIAYHALFFTHFYSQATMDGFTPWAEARPEVQFLQSVPWPPHDDPQVVEPYTRQELLGYWEFCEANIDAWVDKLDLDASDCGFPWYQMGKLEHQILNIRHTQQHVGQLAELLFAAKVDLDWF